MITFSTNELLLKLRQGTPDATDSAHLEQTSAKDLVDDLRSRFGLTFQERHVGKKWEISLARSFKAELAARRLPNSHCVTLSIVPIYVSCIILSIEDDRVTGISFLNRLAVRPIRKPTPGLAITTGRGHKFDKSPDGWSVKPLRKRTVKLNEAFLVERGWDFGHMSPLMGKIG